MDRVLEDYASSPLSEAERALLAFVEKLCAAAAEIRQQDVDALTEAGWSEEAVYDAITVSALFNFYTRWCDGAGVHALSDEGFRRGARQMAARGYEVNL